MSSIKKTDDYFHTAEGKLDWRESYYFNFVDTETGTSGFTTIGILPNLRKGEFVFALFRQDKLDIYYKEQTLENAPSSESISDGALTYRLIEPMQKWDIAVANESFSVQLKWKARLDPFDFGVGSGTSWKGHFEQSGIADGEAAFADGRKSVRIQGFSQRDKSWGQRDWYIESWFALHAQFESRAIGLRKDTLNGMSYVSGGLSGVGKQLAASSVEVQVDFDKHGKTPVGALTTVRYADGEVDKLSSKLISPKSFFKFSRNSPKGTTDLFEGMALHKSLQTGEVATGLIEFLFTHPKA